MKRVITSILVGILPLACYAVDGPTFEVASVKIAGPETQPPYKVTGGPGTGDPGRFHGPHMSMYSVLMRAFGADPDQIRGPGWLTSLSQNYFNIDAVVPSGTSPEDFQKMLQKLLIDRFHLVFHRETRIMPGYALVVDTGGAKIKRADGADPDMEAPAPEAMRKAPKGDDGFPTVRGPFMLSITDRPGRVRTKYQERSIADFTADVGRLIATIRGLSPVDSRPRVVDKTGLTGQYTFVLEYYDPTGVPAGFGDPADVPDVFTALRKQLGLRLDKLPDVPVEIIVVESVDKAPTEN